MDNNYRSSIDSNNCFISWEIKANYMEEIELWKPVVGYEGIYEVSDKGRVKSLDRKVSRGSVEKTVRERVKKPYLGDNGYYTITLNRDGKGKTRRIHQLVVESFLDHKPNGYTLVVDHKDRDKTNNKLSNLRIVTNRKNSSYKRENASSQYTGVCWSKVENKWLSNITINRKSVHIGYYDNEYDAHLAYQEKLKTLS